MIEAREVNDDLQPRRTGRRAPEGVARLAPLFFAQPPAARGVQCLASASAATDPRSTRGALFLRATPIEATAPARADSDPRAAREAFVRAHEDDVWRAVARILGPSRRAQWEDVAQDALVKVITALPGFDPEGLATARTWVLTIAARAAIDALRKSRRAERRSVDPAALGLDRELESAEAALAARELAERVAAAMEQLPDDQRVALVLRAYHDLDYAEIAVATATSVQGVKARLHRAREALARLVGRQREGAR